MTTETKRPPGRPISLRKHLKARLHREALSAIDRLISLARMGDVAACGIVLQMALDAERDASNG